jgi:hypothetical protein
MSITVTRLINRLVELERQGHGDKDVFLINDYDQEETVTGAVAIDGSDFVRLTTPSD